MKRLTLFLLALVLACGGAGYSSDVDGKPVLVGTRGEAAPPPPDPDPPPPPPPEGSAMEIGANLGTFKYYEVTPIFTNALHQGYGLIDKAKAGISDEPANVGADECPTEDFEAVTQFFPRGQTGTLTVRVTGDFSSVAIRSAQPGDAILSSGTYNAGTNTRDVTINIGGVGTRPADPLRIQFTGTKKSAAGTPGEGVAGIVAARPGYTPDDLETQKITDEFIAFVEHIKVLRLMDLQLINTKDNFILGADFAKRPTLGACSTSLSYRPNGTSNPTLATDAAGVPLELIEALATEAGKDLWVHIPYFATDAFVQSTMAHLHANIPSTTKVYIEWVNEIWNSGGGFEQYTAAISDAAADVNGLWGVSSFHMAQAHHHWTGLQCNAAGNAIIVTTPTAHPYPTPRQVVADGFHTFNLSVVTTTSIDATHFSIPATCTPSASIGYGEGAGIVDNATTSNLVQGTSKRILAARDRLVMRRIKEISDITRSVVGDSNMMTRYRPVFAWQAGIDRNRDYWGQLSWLQLVYGGARAVNGYLYGIAGAPYYNLDATRAGGSNLFGSRDASLTVQDYLDTLALTAKYAKQDYGFSAKAGAALHFGIESLQYEGGPDMQAGGDSGATNNAKKNTVNVHPDMKAPYKAMISDAMRYGTNRSLYVAYFHNVARDPNDTNAGTNTWFWDTDSLTNTAAGKWAAIREMGAEARPTPTRNVGTGTHDCRRMHGQYEDITPTLMTGAYPNFSNASLGQTSHNQIYFLWYEQASTPQTRTLTFHYTNNFGGWAMHIDVNGTRIASSQALNAVPANLTTVKTIGPFTFTSQPGINGIEIVKASGGTGVDVECRAIQISQRPDAANEPVYLQRALA